MNTDATSKRAEFIAALRELADFYEQHPDMPTPDYPEILMGIRVDDDDAGVAEIERVAGILGVPVMPPGKPTPNSKHYQAYGRFGPGGWLFPTLSLRVYYIPQSERVS